MDSLKNTNLQARCDVCDIWFNSPISFGPNAFGTVTMAGNTINCPKGHRAYIPDGKFTIKDQLISALEVDGLTRSESEKLREILNTAMKGGHSPEKLRRIIEKEFPGKSNLADFISKLSEPQMIAAVIAILISYMAWQYPKAPQEAPKIQQEPMTIRQVSPRATHQRLAQETKRSLRRKRRR